MSAPRRIRCQQREAQWRTSLNKAAAQLMLACPNHTEEISDRLEREIEDGPDFSRCRRGSEFKSPPQVNTDRNFIARIMFMANVIERKSWLNRAKGKQGGTFGRSAIALLHVLLYVVNKKSGYLAPSYDTLARLSRMSRRSVITAMQVLERMGFVTIHRRVRRVKTLLGVKMVQDCNAYEYHLPKGLGALAWSIFKPSSECKNFSASNPQKKNTAYEREKAENSAPDSGGNGDLRQPQRTKSRTSCEKTFENGGGDQKQGTFRHFTDGFGSLLGQNLGGKFGSGI